jgi:DNA-binding beta-propeller fold protein YncE
MIRPHFSIGIAVTLGLVAVHSFQSPSANAAPPTLGKLYWSNFSFGTIESANLDGTGKQVVVSGLGDPRGVEFDNQAGHLYWTDLATHKIQRSDANGANIINVVSLGTSHANDIVVDQTSSRLYWTDNPNGRIQRSDLLGNNIETLITTGTNELTELELDVSNSKMYWTEFTSGRIRSANLNGTSPQTLVSGLAEPRGLALDLLDGKVYWTEFGGGSNPRIQRSNLDGSNIQLLFQGVTVDEPGGISLDPIAGLLYWVEPDSIQRSTLDGASLTTLVADLQTSYAGDLALVLPVPESGALALASFCLFSIVVLTQRRRAPTSDIRR